MPAEPPPPMPEVQSVETAKIAPPTKTKAAEKPEALIPVEPHDEPSTPAAPRLIVPEP